MCLCLFFVRSWSTSGARQHLLPKLKILIAPRQERSVSAFHPTYLDPLLSALCRGHRRADVAMRKQRLAAGVELCVCVCVCVFPSC